MAWTYHQTSGQLSIEGEELPIYWGYAGYPPHVNDPDAQTLRNIGPLPRGRYVIEAPYQHPALGPYVMNLVPCSVNNMHGRSGFRFHGDSIKNPGKASNGCIVLSRAGREVVWTSGDHILVVVK